MEGGKGDNQTAVSGVGPAWRTPDRNANRTPTCGKVSILGTDVQASQSVLRQMPSYYIHDLGDLLSIAWVACPVTECFEFHLQSPHLGQDGGASRPRGIGGMATEASKDGGMPHTCHPEYSPRRNTPRTEQGTSVLTPEKIHCRMGDPRGCIEGCQQLVRLVVVVVVVGVHGEGTEHQDLKWQPPN